MKHWHRPYLRHSLLTLLCALTAACGSGESQRRQPSEIEITPSHRTAEPSTERGGSAVSVQAPPEPVVLTERQAVGVLDRALRSLQERDFGSARQQLERLLNNPEYGAVAEYNLGVVTQTEGDPAEAIRHYERALQADPRLAPALTALIRLELLQGDVDGAQLAFHRTLQASDQAVDIRAAGLQIRLHRSEYERAIREARDILIQDEGNIDAHLALALAYYYLHQNELAKFVLETAIERAPERVDLWLAKARIQMDEASDTAAMASLRQALEIDPNLVEAHNNLGVLLHRSRNDAEAARHLRQAIELRPDYLEAYLNLSNSLKAEGQLLEAEGAIRDALRINPRFAQAYYNLGLLYLDTQFPDMTVVERLGAAVDALNRYRAGMGSALASDDPVMDYINEALTRLDAERQLSQFGASEQDQGSQEESPEEEFEESPEEEFEESPEEEFEESPEEEFEESPEEEFEEYPEEEWETY